MSSPSSVLPRLAYTSVFGRTVRQCLTCYTVVVADLLALSAAGILAVLIRYPFHAQYAPSDWLHVAPALLVIFAVFAFSDLYPGIACSPTDEFRVVVRSSTIGFLLLIVTTFFLRDGLQFSRIVIALTWLLTMLLVPLSRRLLRGYCALQPWWGVPTVILGEAEAGVMMLKLLQGHPRLGLRPVALLTDHHMELGPAKPHSNFFQGDMSCAHRFATDHPGCYAVIAMPTAGSERVRSVISGYVHMYRNVLIIPDLFGMRSLAVSAKDICGVLTLRLDQRLVRPIPKVCKRLFDLLLTLGVLLMLLPVFAVLCVAVRLSSPGPIFYGQRRIGRNGQPFTVWKLRSMRVNADAILQEELAADPELKAEWERDHKLKRDPRVTGIGSLLRKSSLDELPQLWNVLCGEMSLVGPRPIVPAEIEKYGDSFEQYRLVCPGVTGLWQVSGRNNTTYDLRTRIDDYYVRNWSLSLDTYILLRTVKTLLLSEGAY